MLKKRALISVYNKKGLKEFANKLQNEFNYEIISTGNTFKELTSYGINSKQVSEITNYPEILNGRVKTLHPSIHGAILADTQKKSHLEILEEQDITPISLVVVNLYPFEDVAKKDTNTTETLIENIDIGGPTMLRSAAKNYKNVTVVSSPEDYDSIIEEFSNNNGESTLKTREILAIKAFKLTSKYDTLIAKTLSKKLKFSEYDNTVSIELNKIQDLRYGENPHQKAALYKDYKDVTSNIDFEVLQGKKLSYNNLVDLTAALKIINEFNTAPAACIIKHTNPCGAALGKTILEAYNKALSTDPLSAFGGIVGLNDKVEKELANQLSDIFLEVIAAPDFTEEALSILSKKKNLRLIKYIAPLNLSFDKIIRQVAGGVLIQDYDNKNITKEEFNFVTKKKPSDAEQDDLLFAWKIAKHLSSNAIVIAKNGQTLGLGCGQTSRIASMEIALRQACDEAKDAVVASDGFFPAIDNIQAAAQSRISSIIQPGGSIKDKDVIETTNKLGISMVFTGARHFKH